ncbi:MAG: hypothetical protein AB1566_01560 [Chloroflexota bacterium]
MGQIEHFIPAEAPLTRGVLARFLLPLPANVVSAYLQAYTSSGEVVLDPFCQADVLVREAARSRRSAIATDFNPIATFVAETSLKLLAPRELEGAFNRLGDSIKLHSTLRSHLTQLYQANCPHCGQQVTAHYFLWSRKTGRPVKKHFHCRTCRASHTEPVDDFDQQVLAQVETRGFHYWFVLERLGPLDDEGRRYAERLLDLYTPRNLYALVTILTKIEQVFEESSDDQRALKLMLLECLDYCSKLNSPGDYRGEGRVAGGPAGGEAWEMEVSRLASQGGPVPKPPPLFLEVNVWEAFEHAYRLVRHLAEVTNAEASALRLARMPEELFERAPGGGALPWSEGAAVRGLVRQASLRRLSEELPAESVDLVFTSPPRPSRGGFLALSYLWSGWLFGKEAASVFQPETLFHARSPSDWDWYYKAMALSLRALFKLLKSEKRAVFYLPEAQAAHANALILSAVAAGFLLERVVFQPSGASSGQVPQAGWYYVVVTKPSMEKRVLDLKEPREGAKPSFDDLTKIALQATREIIARRGEPLAFPWLNLSIYLKLAEVGLLKKIVMVEWEDYSPLEYLRDSIEKALEKGLKRDLVKLEWQPGATQALWWLARPDYSVSPVSDQVEWAVYNVLSTAQLTTHQAVERVVYSLFPGPLTPESELIQRCLESYGRRISATHWQLLDADRLDRRTTEHSAIVAVLAELGHQLGCRVWINRRERKKAYRNGTLTDLLEVNEKYVNLPALLHDLTGKAELADVIWYQGNGLVCAFQVEWTAMLSDPLLAKAFPGLNGRRYLVVPQERVELVEFKLSRSPLLRQAMAQGGWDFIKYQPLCEFFQRPEQDRSLELFSQIVGLKPLVEQFGVQLQLF